MAIPFPQTTRALQADQDQVSLLALVFLTIMLVLWGMWFFTAPVYTYISTKQVHITLHPQPSWSMTSGSRRPQAFAHYLIQGQFPATEVAHVKVGQTAKIHFEGHSLLPTRAYTAQITEVDKSNQLAHALLEVPMAEADPLKGAVVSHMDIATNERTPMAFLLGLVMGGGQPPIQEAHP